MLLLEIHSSMIAYGEILRYRILSPESLNYWACNNLIKNLNIIFQHFFELMHIEDQFFASALPEIPKKRRNNMKFKKALTAK